MTMSDAARARLNAFNAEQPDWEARCPRCGARLSGKLEDLKHACLPAKPAAAAE